MASSPMLTFEDGMPAGRRRYGLSDLAILAALAALVIVAFWEVVGQGRVFFFRDFATFFYPKRWLVAQSLKAGRIPFWSSLNGCGEPVLGAYQHAVFYPPAVIYYIFPLPASVMWFMLVHVVLSGMGAYYMMRVWGARRSAAAFTAFGWAFSPTFISLIDYVSFQTSLSWLPWCMAFARRTTNGAHRPGFVGLSICFAMAVLAGAPEPVMLVAGAVAMYAAWHAVTTIVFRKSRTGLRAALIVLAALLAGGVLAGVEVVPFLHTLRYSARRQSYPAEDAAKWAAAPGDALLMFLPRLYLYADRGGIYWRSQHWLKTVYLGVMVPIMAAWTLLAVRRKRNWFFAVLAVPFVLMALGDHTPFWRFLYDHVPGVGLIRYPVKFYPTAALAMAALAGFALEDAALCGRRRQILRPALLGAMVLLPAAVFSAGWWYMNYRTEEAFRRITPMNLSGVSTLSAGQISECFEATQWSLGRSGAILAGAAAALLLIWLLARLRIPRPYGGIAAVIVLFADIGIFGAHLNPVAGPEVYTEKPARSIYTPQGLSDTRLFVSAGVRMTIREGRLQGFEDSRKLREFLTVMKGAGFTDDAEFLHWLIRTSTPAFTSIRQLDDWLAPPARHPQFLTDLEYEVSKETFYPSSNVLFGVPMITDFEPMAVGWNFDIMRKMINRELDEKRVRFLSRMWGAGVALDLQEGPPGFAYQPLEKPGRRAILADHYMVAKDDAEAFSIVAQSDADVIRRILLFPQDATAARDFLGPGAADAPPENASEPGLARVVYDNGNRCVFEVETSKRAILFVADNYFPNFAARVDGLPARIWRANYGFRAMPVEPGKHTVEFFWRPYDLYAGIAATFAALVCLLVVARKRGHRTVASSQHGRP